MRPGRLAAAITIAVLSASGASARHNPPGQPQTGTISGRVVLADSKRPAGDAVVTVSDGQNTVARTTDENGAFTFPNLKPGQYFLTANKERYLPVTYGQIRPAAGPGVAIRLAAGDRLDRFELALPLASVIAGLVTTTSGEPLQDASITALRYTWRTGTRTLTVARTATSDDRGEYRLTFLLPGDYVISARPPRRATDGTPAEIYYPLSLSRSQAAPVALTIGEVKVGVDFRLPRIALARVRGVVIRADGSPAAEVPVEATELGGGTVSQPGAGSYANASGRFELIGFSPGRFRVTTMSEFGLWATTEVVIGDRDVEGVELRLQPMGTLSGRMVMDDRESTPVPNTLVVWNPLDIPGLSRLPPASIRSGTDGRFTLTRVREGNALLSFPTIPDGLTLKSVVVNGRDAFDVPFDLGASQSAENVVVTWTRRRSSLVGTLVDQQQRPAADYLILVYSTDERHWFIGARHLMTLRPATDGRYTFPDLPPGSYRLAVLSDAEEGQWFDPAFLRGLAAASVAVTIREGAETVQNLQTRVR